MAMPERSFIGLISLGSVDQQLSGAQLNALDANYQMARQYPQPIVSRPPLSRWKVARLNLVMRFANWLRVPVTPHQRFFGSKRETSGNSLKTVSS